MAFNNTTRRQRGTVYDLIAQGEIEGVVGGYSGVYFNGSSLLDSEAASSIAPKYGTATVTNVSNKATLTNFGKLFDGVDLAKGDRYVLIRQAGAADTIDGAVAKGGNEIKVTTPSFLNPKYLSNATGELPAFFEDYVNHFVRITLADGTVHTCIFTAIYDDNENIKGDWKVGQYYQVGQVVRATDEDGSYYIASGTAGGASNGDSSNLSGGSDTGSTNLTWSTYTPSSGKATIEPPLSGAVLDNAAISVDFMAKVESGLGTNTVTLAIPAPSTPTSVPVRVSPAIMGTGTETITPRYDGASVQIYKGTRSQKAYSISNFVPSAAFSFAQGTQLTWSTYGRAPSGSQTQIIFDSNNQTFGQNTSSEIDAVDINIEFPGGLRHVTDLGNDIQAYVEFQIVLEWRPAGQESWESRLVYGNNYTNGSLAANNVETFNPFTQLAPLWSAPGAGDGLKLAARDYIYGSKGIGKSSYRGDSDALFIKNNAGPFLATFTVDLQSVKPFDQWRVLIRRMSPDTSSDYTRANNNFSGPTTLKTIDCYIYDKLSYPTSAYSVVNFSAETYNTPPSRSYHIRGKKVKVPSNYFTREETGTVAKYTRHKTTGVDTGSHVTWDGSFRGVGTNPTSVNFRKVYTNNPAWIFYDIITDKEIGLGEFLEEADIDIYSLFQIARYCDELVPDGKGGLEPRFTCNVYLSRQEEAYKVLKDLATVFRSMMFWLDGKITAIQDSPKEPVYTFTQGNVKDGMFEYSYTGQRARSNQVNVTWNNPEELYKKTVLTVEDTANIIAQNRIVQKDIVAFGCTSESQAHRLAQWHLLTDAYETEVLTFSTGINGAFLRPGDIVNVQDQTLFNIEQSGRVSSSSSTTTLVLDREVSLTGSASNYNLYLIYSGAAAYLQQPSAVLDGVTYSRGEILLTNAAGVSIVDNASLPLTAELAANLVDDSGNLVSVQFSEDSRIEIKQLSTYTAATKTVVVTGSFSSNPNTDTVWAIVDRNVETQDIKKYRVMGISEENPSEYSITASKYYEAKFDELEQEKPVVTNEFSNSSGRNDVVPAPRSVAFDLLPSFSNSSETSSTLSYKASISWGSPLETFKGTERDYRYLESYEIRHNFYGEITEIKDIPPSTTSYDIPNISAGTYTIAVRVKSDFSTYSNWTEKVLSAGTPVLGNSLLGLVSQGGTLNTTIVFDQDVNKILLKSSTYTYVSPSNVVYSNTANTADTISEDFSSLPNSQSAYFLFDYAQAIASSSNPWRAVQVHTDATIEDTGGNATNYNYLKLLGASNNGLQTLTNATGGISIPQNSATVTGTNTSFTTELAVGDLVKISNSTAVGTENAVSDYRKVREIVSNTSLVLDSIVLRAYSSKSMYKVSYSPDSETDAILAKVLKDGSGVYTIETYVTSSGEDGAGSDIVFLRSATAPDTPADSAGIPSLPDQWYTNPPSGTALLWASKGSKAVGETKFDWGAPYQVEGTAVAEIAVYKVNDSTTPTGGSYNFTTNSLNITGLTAGWSQTPPSLANNSDAVYKSIALFVGGPEETAATATWSTPAVSAFRQDGSIGNDAKAVKLTPSSYVINYSTAGGENDTIAFTTAVQSISGSPAYRFLVGGVEKQNTTTPTFTLADADEPAIGGVKEVKVEVYDTTTSPDTLLATDTVSIYAVQDGSDAIIGLLTNSAHTVSADNAGTVSSFSGAGGTFKVFVGGTDVTTSCTFSVVGTPANTTTSINSSTGVYAITALSANQDNVTYQAVIPAATAGTAADVTITAIYSISKSKKGDVGDDGASLDIIFQRSSSPATPTASSGTPSGWDTNPPAGTNTLWASQGVKAVGATNYTWGTPYQVEGTSVAEVYIYRKNSNAGASGGSYNFTTNTLTAPTNWSLAPPALTADGDEVYVAVGLFSGAPTATAATTTWSTPVVYAKRTDGISADVDIIFQRSSSSPATPTASSGTPSGWDTNPPAGTNTLWASNGTKEGGATNYTWSAPYQIEGTSVAEVYIYRKNSNAGASGGSYNFTTNTLTAPTNWSLAPPALGSDTDKVYVAVGLFSGAPTATAATTTWSTPVVYAERQDGTNGVALNLTASPVSFAYDGSAYDPDGTSTISLSASGGTITSVTYSDDVASAIGAVATGNNAGSTFTFQNDLSLANAKASATVTAAVTGTDSKGNTGVSFGSISAKIPTTIQGTDGQNGVSITGPRTTTGHIYYQSSTASAPTFPAETNVTYDWSTGRLSGGVIGTGSTNWNQNPPTFASGNSNKYWYVPYSVTEASFGGTIAVDFVGSTVYQGVGFSGLVTFTAGGALGDGSTEFDPADKISTGGAAADVNADTITTINGGRITADSITAAQLQISREDGSGSGIFMDYNSGNPRIRIFNGTTERVRIGFLSS